MISRCAVVVVAAVLLHHPALAQDATRPLADLDVLTGAEWQGGGSGFRTTLKYRWVAPGRMLEASNEVTDTAGKVLARYHGMYAWDAGRREIVFWTAAESGEVHRGRAWWRDGVLWHEAEVSGGRIDAYASAIRAGRDRMEYFAAYGERAASASLLQTTPIVYTRSAGQSNEPMRIDGETMIRHTSGGDGFGRLPRSGAQGHARRER